MAASGSAVLFGGDDTLIISGQSPTVLPIDSIDFDSNVTVVGNTFQFDDDGDQVLSVSMKAAAGSNQTVAYTLQLYDNTSSSVVASYSSEAPGGAQGAAQQLLQLVFTADSTHTYSLRILVPSGGDPAMALLGPTFQAVITTLAGGGGGGTVGPGTVNYIPIFTAATVVGDSSFTNLSAGALGVGNDVAISITAGTVSAGTTGKDITLTASAAKAASNANGGNINLTPGAGDGSGIAGYIQVTKVSFGGVGATYPFLARSGSDELTLYNGALNTTASLSLANLSAGGQIHSSAYGGFLLNAGASGVSGTQLGNAQQYCWFSGATPGGGFGDTGIGRSAAGQVKITNGDSTSYLTIGNDSGPFISFNATGASVPVSAAGMGRIRYNDTTKTFQVSADGGAYASLSTGSSENTPITAYCTSITTVSSNAALNDITGMSATIASGGIYLIRCVLMTSNAGGASGLRVALTAGTATFNSVRVVQQIWDLSTRVMSAVSTITTLGTATSKATISSGDHEMIIEGYLDCNAGGTVKCQFGQGTSDASNTSVNVGSWMFLQKMN